MCMLKLGYILYTISDHTYDCQLVYQRKIQSTRYPFINGIQSHFYSIEIERFNLPRSRLVPRPRAQLFNPIRRNSITLLESRVPHTSPTLRRNHTHTRLPLVRGRGGGNPFNLDAPPPPPPWHTHTHTHTCMRLHLSICIWVKRQPRLWPSIASPSSSSSNEIGKKINGMNAKHSPVHDRDEFLVRTKNKILKIIAIIAAQKNYV
ncbi:hypothetical protein DFH27DRAFT_188663 [Peziza echinospora]|nr:hypothetical protein DFH27DRAFT_188663 [Peziza echinospora]